MSVDVMSRCISSVKTSTNNPAAGTKRELEECGNVQAVESSCSSESSLGETAAMRKCRTIRHSTDNSDRKPSSNKFSKFGKKLRESCRNLRQKPHTDRDRPKQIRIEDYITSNNLTESLRSKSNYAIMDFSGKEGVIIQEEKEAMPLKIVRKKSKENGNAILGNNYYRRIDAQKAEKYLKPTQVMAHKVQPWFHENLHRDDAQSILLAQPPEDGIFLVRCSSNGDGYVLSYTHTGKVLHAPIITELNTKTDGIIYSVDDGRIRFYDILQLIEFYQINQCFLLTTLSSYVIRKKDEENETSLYKQSQTNGINQKPNKDMISVLTNGVGDDYATQPISDVVMSSA